MVTRHAWIQLVSRCVGCVHGAELSTHVRTRLVDTDSHSSALLVIFSRRDSVPSTWAATLLTGALVIAAMVQKMNQSITLHHAVLTLK